MIRLLLLIGLCAAVAPAATLTVIPDNTSGMPGETIGFGFRLENPSNYLVVTLVEYQTPISIGIFTPFLTLPANFQPVQGVWQQSYSSAAQTGLGELAINPFEVLGTQSAGQVALTYDLYSVSPLDPSFDPFLHTASVGQQVTAPLTVTVAVPEPAMFLMTGMGLLLVLTGRGLVSGRTTITLIQLGRVFASERSSRVPMVGDARDSWDESSGYTVASGTASPANF